LSFWLLEEREDVKSYVVAIEGWQNNFILACLLFLAVLIPQRLRSLLLSVFRIAALNH